MSTKRHLSALFVSKVGKSGRYHDKRGHGLSLLVSDRGSKRWEQRITVSGRRRTLGLGSYPDVSLREARHRALRNRLLVDDGVDPLAQKRVERRRVPTFAEAAEAAIVLRRSRWRAPDMERRWRRSFEIYAYPRLGSLRVTDIETAHVAEVLEAVHRRTPKTVPTIRQRIAFVMAWAVGRGFRKENPCSEAIDAVMAEVVPPAERHRALPYPQVPEAVVRIRSSDHWIGTRLLFEFVVLTAVRNNEGRGALWSEMDLDAGKWVVPAGRMKERSAHEVPLSTATLAVLNEARESPELENARRVRGNHDIVFPSMRGRVLYNNALSKVLRTLAIDAVPHGFRSSFRTWAQEKEKNFDLAEVCLSHAVGTHVMRRYGRSKLYDLRIPIMEDWAQYVVSNRSA